MQEETSEPLIPKDWTEEEDEEQPPQMISESTTTSGHPLTDTNDNHIKDEDHPNNGGKSTDAVWWQYLLEYHNFCFTLICFGYIYIAYVVILFAPLMIAFALEIPDKSKFSYYFGDAVILLFRLYIFQIGGLVRGILLYTQGKGMLKSSLYMFGIGIGIPILLLFLFCF